MAKRRMKKNDYKNIEPTATEVQKMQEVPISSAYPAIDNDLARDNIENDIPAADLQDL